MIWLRECEQGYFGREAIGSSSRHHPYHRVSAKEGGTKRLWNHLQLEWIEVVVVPHLHEEKTQIKICIIMHIHGQRGPKSVPKFPKSSTTSEPKPWFCGCQPSKACCCNARASRGLGGGQMVFMTWYRLSIDTTQHSYHTVDQHLILKTG